MSALDDPRDASAAHKVSLKFGNRPSKLSGWAAPEAAENANDEIILSLMASDVLLGTLRRDTPRPDVDENLGYSGPPPGFVVADFGLEAFAAISGLGDLAIRVSGEKVRSKRHRLPDHDSEARPNDPLGSRGAALAGVKLTDLWLQSARDLTLRFEGIERDAKSVSAYQCTPGANPLLVMLGEQTIGGLLSLATVKLLNPLLPVLLVFKTIDGSIEGIDLIPFPSLVRGGLHEAERLIMGAGGDDLTDLATVSGALLASMLSRSDNPTRGIGSIVLDPAVHTGLEPILNDDILGWIVDYLGIAIEPATSAKGSLPQFIADRLSRHSAATERPGHRLHLPADSIPTLSSVIKNYPEGVADQRCFGSMAVAEWRRHGHIWSVWQPSIGDWLDGLQGAGERQFAPLLDIRSTGEDGTEQRAINVPWPLTLALRERMTRIERQSPFEVAADISLPLIRSRANPVGGEISAVILTDRADQSVLALLESLARQESVAIADVVVVRPTAKPDPELSAALVSLFPDHHRIIALPANLGRMERLKVIGQSITTRQLMIIDGGTLIPDARVAATLLAMLDAPDVGTVGCLVRGTQPKSPFAKAGYAPAKIDFRSVPSMSFAPIDPEVFRQPATYPVVANSMAMLVTTKDMLDDVTATGSSFGQPVVDDLLLGLQTVERRKHNLCTTLVSVYSDAPVVKETDLAVSLPYRLADQLLDRILTSTINVQLVR